MLFTYMYLIEVIYKYQNIFNQGQDQSLSCFQVRQTDLQELRAALPMFHISSDKKVQLIVV